MAKIHLVELDGFGWLLLLLFDPLVCTDIYLGVSTTIKGKLVRPRILRRTPPRSLQRADILSGTKVRETKSGTGRSNIREGEKREVQRRLPANMRYGPGRLATGNLSVYKIDKILIRIRIRVNQGSRAGPSHPWDWDKLVRVVARSRLSGSTHRSTSVFSMSFLLMPLLCHLTRRFKSLILANPNFVGQ